MRRPAPSTVLRLAAAAWVGPHVARAALAHRPDARPTAARDDITVVVPARDEADRLEPLLVALGERYEVVVVDDGSTDGTAALARRSGATVVEAGDRPAGWAGKTWALQRGVEAANGSWIVHLDADVRPAADTPTAAVAAAEELGADLLTVATRVVAPPVARWLHASMLVTLVCRTGGPGGLSPGREMANGQVLAARRTLLAESDGWSAVADHVTEDVALARHLASVGRHVAMVDGDAEIEFASFGEVWRGWGRSIGLPGIEPRWRSVLDLVALAAVMPLPLARLVLGRGDALDIALLAARWGAALGVGRAYRPAGPAVWMSPIADPVAIGTVAASAFRRHISWRGRRWAVPRVPPGRSGTRRTS
ncbi:dolichol-phosphate mannosyltransferase [Ilumatobacter fluminis]|uniref:Dolichol-phosphate mannosyltransferase n=1 Tax=Ilumatobacter fluminis TaxID=467091 RepID=A0A4R7HWD0_9ACTN|nr:glycosyltransferase family 2 protein [Ilumatobacter fluminis]TDT15110.1 dolichol-phosphate mannosyltransferase [Ilumatobacter fluminis]